METAISTFSLNRDMNAIINSILASTALVVLVDAPEAQKYLTQALGSLQKPERVSLELAGPNSIALVAVGKTGLGEESDRGVILEVVLVLAVAGLIGIIACGISQSYTIEVEAGDFRLRLTPPQRG